MSPGGPRSGGTKSGTSRSPTATRGMSHSLQRDRYASLRNRGEPRPFVNPFPFVSPLVIPRRREAIPLVSPFVCPRSSPSPFLLPSPFVRPFVRPRSPFVSPLVLPRMPFVIPTDFRVADSRTDPFVRPRPRVTTDFGARRG